MIYEYVLVQSILYFLTLGIPIVQTTSVTMAFSDFCEIDGLFDSFRKIGFEDFSTHLLLGFPGEKESDVQESIDFIIKHSPKHVVASAFMAHPAIDASKYEDQVSENEVKKRIKKCEEEFKSKRIKVATDWGSVTNKIMNRIRASLDLDLKDYKSDKK